MRIASETRCDRCEAPIRAGETHVVVLTDVDNFTTGESRVRATYRHVICPDANQQKGR